MAAWSCLKNIGKLNTLGSAIAAFKNVPITKAVNYTPIRTSHERTLPIKASNYGIAKLRDMIVLYLFVGGLPLIAIATYANVFIGPAELALIPEGYEPKHWEYYRHPITRFFARYVLVSPQEHYERNLHNIFISKELSDMAKLRNKVKQKMREKLDYQSWYYEKPYTKYAWKYQEVLQDSDDNRTDSGFRVNE